MTASLASARPVAARRIRTLAATTVVAAVAGTAFVPVTAFAADQAQASGNPLTMTLGAPTLGNQLKRGGATESMTLKVTNAFDKAQEFSSWLLGEVDGPSPRDARLTTRHRCEAKGREVWAGCARGTSNAITVGRSYG